MHAGSHVVLDYPWLLLIGKILHHLNSGHPLATPGFNIGCPESPEGKTSKTRGATKSANVKPGGGEGGLSKSGAGLCQSTVRRKRKQQQNKKETCIKQALAPIFGFPAGSKPFLLRRCWQSAWGHDRQNSAGPALGHQLWVPALGVPALVPALGSQLCCPALAQGSQL